MLDVFVFSYLFIYCRSTVFIEAACFEFHLERFSELAGIKAALHKIHCIDIYIYSILMHKTSCVRTEAASTCYGGSMRAFPSQVHIGMNTQDSRDEGCSITQRQLFSVDAHSGVLFTVLYCFLDEVGDPPIANSRGLGSFWR